MLVLKWFILGATCLLLLAIPSREDYSNPSELMVPTIGPDEITSWNRDTIEQMIYIVSKEEGFGDPELLIALAGHESVFLKYPKILDSNNKYSFGLYHWQKDSFNDYCIKKYHLPNDIMDPVIQTRCSIRAIKDGYFKKLWSNSAKKIDRDYKTGNSNDPKDTPQRWNLFSTSYPHSLLTL